MHLLNRHILTLGRLFLVLFFVANSGFTVVERYCTMAIENQGKACADEDDCCSAATCKDEVAPRPQEAPSLTVSMSCHVVSIAGGLQGDPTIVEKGSNVPYINVPLFLAPDLPLAIYHQADRSLHLLSPASVDVSPHSVETYVLNSTFLI